MEKSKMSKKREERVGLGTYRKELTVPDKLRKPGYVLRWVNDDVGRLDAAQRGGYQFVQNPDNIHIGEGIETGNSDLGSRISRIVDKSARLGNPMRAYLMEIKQEWYEEDQNKKLAEVESIDEQILQGRFGKERESGYYGGAKYQIQG